MASREEFERSRLTGLTGREIAGQNGFAALLDTGAPVADRPTLCAVIGVDGTAQVLAGVVPNRVQVGLVAAVRDPAGLAAADAPRGVTVLGHAYRVTAMRLGGGEVLLTATTTQPVGDTVRHVVRLELAAGASLIVLLGTFIFFGARWRLRPLEDMVETASAIAEGGPGRPNLSRRMASRGRPGREVEQLRVALNAMLEQVEDAFVAREHAAAHLRGFAADASHELRTPLAAIRGYLQLYERGMLVDESERSRALSRMGAEAERMTRLVDELLALARLDQRPLLRPLPVDLARVAREATADLRAQQPQRPVHVTSPDTCLVLADEPTLRRIVGNLTTNVRVHTPATACTHISIRRAGGYAVFRVADAGPGMRPQDTGRIFDRFFRAAAATTTATTAPGAAGSGLGMAIVRAAVDAHDGTVRVVSAPGEGLTVTVTLPLATELSGG
ncbi:HAMP domain-containing sensor histidine kinase [Streptomyces sp. SID3343]|uniref:sensor histidine kinase n=1 Tax=Streptomyces sp. SID3343 TaxID=2690260 RepID=UPI0031F87923